jgi:hypothetical protein
MAAETEDESVELAIRLQRAELEEAERLRALEAEDALIAARENARAQQLSRPSTRSGTRVRATQQQLLERRVKARSSEVRWHCGMDVAFNCIMVEIYGPVALLGLLVPIIGFVSAHLLDWRAALTGPTLLAAASVALRVWTALSTPNFTHACIAVALALAALHLMFLGFLWTCLLW